MARRFLELVILGFAVCFFAACAVEYSGNVEESEATSQQIYETVELDELDEKGETGMALLDGLLVKSLVSISNADYSVETDDPVYAGCSDVAYTSDGYYFFSSDCYLYFLDRETEQCVKVCAKLNCSHEGESCDAYFDISTWRTEEGIWYNEGYLYVLKEGSYNEYILVRFAPDGSGREEVTSLFSLESSESNSQMIKCMIVHRGYLYYSLTDSKMEEQAILYRCKLQIGAEPEEYYVFPYTQSALARLKGVGDGLFFEAGFYVNGDVADTDSYFSVVCYLPEGGDIILIKENVQYDYTVAGDEIIYSTYEGIYAYNYVNGASRTVIELGLLCHLSYDGAYLWADDWIGTLISETVSGAERQIYKLDLEGNILAMWNIKRYNSSVWSYFGDESYMFMSWVANYETPESGVAAKLKAFNKSTEEWISLE